MYGWPLPTRCKFSPFLCPPQLFDEKIQGKDKKVSLNELYVLYMKIAHKLLAYERLTVNLSG